MKRYLASPQFGRSHLNEEEVKEKRREKKRNHLNDYDNTYGSPQTIGSSGAFIVPIERAVLFSVHLLFILFYLRSSTIEWIGIV